MVEEGIFKGGLAGVAYAETNYIVELPEVDRGGFSTLGGLDTQVNPLSTFPDNRLMGRAMPAPWVHHSVYVLFIAVEATVALLCWWGACKMARARQDQLAFARARQIETAGYLLAILLQFVGFMGDGGEWFAMWQSQIWNGVDAAFRLTVIITLFLILLYVPDEWEARSGRASDNELGRNEGGH